MTDKYLDEVIREYEKKFNICYNGRINMHEVEKFIPIACRSYARKVLEEIIDAQQFASYGELHQRLLNAHSRLTEKEPKQGGEG